MAVKARGKAKKKASPKNKHVTKKKSALARVFETDDLDEEEEEALLDALDEEEEEQDDENTDPDTEEHEADLSTQGLVGDPEGNGPESAGFDIFTDFARPLALSGTPIYFAVYKNGAYISRKNFPYDIDQLKGEFGDGVFRIVVKAVATNRILKQQTLALGLDAHGSSGNGTSSSRAGTSDGNQPLTVSDVLALTKQAQMEERESLRREMAREKEQSGGVMHVMAEISKQNAAQMNQFMMLMMESQKTSTQQLMTIMQAQIAATAASAVQKPDKALEAMSLVKMMTDSQKSGREEMLKLIELSEAKADEKSELTSKIEALIEKANGGGEKQSGIDRMLALVAPIVTSAIQAQAAAVAAGQGPQQHQQLEAAPPVQHRPPNVRPIRDVQEVTAEAVQAPPQPKPPAPLAGKALTPKQPLPRVEVKPEVPSVKFSPLQNEVMGNLIPQLGQWMVARKDVNEAAAETINLLKSQGRDPVKVAGLFTEADILAVRKRELPKFPIADRWLVPYWRAFQSLISKAS